VASRWEWRPARVRDFGVVAGLVAVVVALSLSTDTFLTKGNVVNLLDQAVVVGLLACGATACLICGVFDLSMSAVLALGAITAVMVTKATATPLGVAAAVTAGGLVGAVNGVVVTTLRVHSFIVTLALGVAYRGIAVIVTGGAIVYPLAHQLRSFQVFARPTVVGGTTVASLVYLGVVAVCAALMGRTVFGRHAYAVGGNTEAARVCGVRVGAVRVGVLTLSGVCAGLAGLVLASRGGSAQPDMGLQLELTAIAAAVVGGTSVLGGHGAVWRGVVGVAFLTLIGNGFNLLGWDTTYQQVVEGVLTLVAVGLDQAFRQRT
jgi:ribose transport system permease protein